ncbi:hypothetical protein MKX08_007724 [Trichoderma sp. CBMAI-0020]|nr:hypothetical protein MKX08_007724 [Trichoderma sp. CBMAI-0020]
MDIEKLILHEPRPKHTYPPPNKFAQQAGGDDQGEGVCEAEGNDFDHDKPMETGGSEQDVEDDVSGSMAGDSISLSEGEFTSVAICHWTVTLIDIADVIGLEDPQRDIFDPEGQEMLLDGFDDNELQGARDYDSTLVDIAALMDVMVFNEDVESESGDEEVPTEAPCDTVGASNESRREMSIENAQHNARASVQADSGERRIAASEKQQ